ncbi:lysylphosphatidylglycerol synthase domain-containing protein [Streptomyces sp. SM1P]
MLLLSAALVANAAGLVLSMLSWRVLVVDGGSPARTSDTARIFFIGVISKFVPGRIWGVLAHVQLGKAVGIAPERMIAAFGLGLVIGMTTGAAAGLLVAPAVFGTGAWVFAPLVLVAAAAVARPGWVGRLVAWTMRLARRPAGAADSSPRALRLSIGWACASWAVSGLHLWVIAVLLGAPPLLSLPVCVGGFALATVAGSLAFVLPDGWGARELVLLAPWARSCRSPRPPPPSSPAGSSACSARSPPPAPPSPGPAPPDPCPPPTRAPGRSRMTSDATPCSPWTTANDCRRARCTSCTGPTSTRARSP